MFQKIGLGFPWMTALFHIQESDFHLQVISRSLTHSSDLLYDGFFQISQRFVQLCHQANSHSSCSKCHRRWREFYHHFCLCLRELDVGSVFYPQISGHLHEFLFVNISYYFQTWIAFRINLCCRTLFVTGMRSFYRGVGGMVRTIHLISSNSPQMVSVAWRFLRRISHLDILKLYLELNEKFGSHMFIVNLLLCCSFSEECSCKDKKLGYTLYGKEKKEKRNYNNINP